MQFADGMPEPSESLVCRLDKQQPFLCILDLILPAIDWPDLRNDIDAGREAAVDQRVSDSLCFLLRSGSGENDFLVSHIESVDRLKSMDYAARLQATSR